jgi:hypothetical protein
LTTGLTVVTGAPGWLGTTLVETLVRGARFRSIRTEPRNVRCVVEPGIDSSALARPGDRVEYRLADMTVLAKARSPSAYPSPFAPVVAEDPARFEGAGFVVIDTRCQKPLSADETRAFSPLTNRENGPALDADGDLA